MPPMVQYPPTSRVALHTQGLSTSSYMQWPGLYLGTDSWVSHYQSVRMLGLATLTAQYRILRQ